MLFELFPKLSIASLLQTQRALTSFWFLDLCPCHPLTWGPGGCWKASCPAVITRGKGCPLCRPSVVSQGLGPSIVLSPTQTADTKDLKPKAQFFCLTTSSPPFAL